MNKQYMANQEKLMEKSEGNLWLIKSEEHSRNLNNKLDKKCKKLSECVGGLVSTCSEANQKLESTFTEVTTKFDLRIVF